MVSSAAVKRDPLGKFVINLPVIKFRLSHRSGLR